MKINTFSLDVIIPYMENTTEESWCMDVVKTKDGKNCLFGHLYDLGGGELMDWFENIATTYMVYPVNDGEIVKQERKHRYFFVVGDKNFKKHNTEIIKSHFIIYPYPKGQNENYDTSYEIKDKFLEPKLF